MNSPSSSPNLGMGWTVLPVSQAETPLRPLTAASATPLAHRTLVAVRRSDALGHPAADALLDELG